MAIGQNRSLPLSRLVFAVLFALPALAHAGGVIGGGGGGGTTPPVHASVEDIRFITVNGKKVIVAWLNRLEYFYKTKDHWDAAHPRPKIPPPPSALMAKFFDAKPNIFQVLTESTIEARLQTPCADRDGKPVDASIVATPPANICMSLSRLHEKLYESNYERQIEALILHELTHLMGGDEDEAVYIQKLVLNDFRYDQLTGFPQRFQSGAMMMWDARQLLDWMRSAQPTEFHHLSFALNSTYSRIRAQFLNSTYQLSPLRATAYDAASQYEIRSIMLKTYACAHDPSLSEESRKSCDQQYNRGFANQATADVDGWMKNAFDLPNCCSRRLRPLVVRRISSAMDVQAELADLDAFFERIGADLHSYNEERFAVIDR